MKILEMQMMKPALRIRKTSIPSLLAPVLLLLSVLPGTSFAATIVVPNSLASVDGNINNVFPFSSPMRYQQVFAASEFSALAAPELITKITFRPDRFFPEPFSTTLPNVQISLSTTSKAPDGLDVIYSNNVGGDDTVVFSGALTLSSAATGSDPLDFDIVINLQTPFLYDPSLGNLLLDVRNFEGNPGSPVVMDADSTFSDPVSRVVGSVIGPTGFQDSFGLVAQFTTTPATAGANVNLEYRQETIWLCSEPVRLEYWVRTVAHNQSDAAGGSRSVWQVSFHGTGFGLWSGDQWQWHGSTSFTHIQNAAGGEVKTEMQRVRAPLLGHRLNYHLWIDVHLTVTPDGATIVDWDLEEPWCQGPLPYTVIGSFETGDLTGWTASGINDGFATVVQEGTCFSGLNTLGLTLNGNFAANVRSSGPAPTSSVGILTSDPIVAGSGIGFLALSENAVTLPVPDPVTLEVRVLDTADVVLHSEVVTTNTVTLDWACPGGELRDGIFSTHLIDTSAYSGGAIRVEFRQHTNYAGLGFFTLIDDVTVIP